MASIRLSSDLLETDLSEEEMLIAKRLTPLSIAYLQNMKVEIIRSIASITFLDDNKRVDEKAVLQHAELMGMKFVLETLITDAVQSTQVSDPSQPASPN